MLQNQKISIFQGDGGLTQLMIVGKKLIRKMAYWVSRIRGKGTPRDLVKRSSVGHQRWFYRRSVTTSYVEKSEL
jgi:hypothetical protein